MCPAPSITSTALLVVFPSVSLPSSSSRKLSGRQLCLILLRHFPNLEKMNYAGLNLDLFLADIWKQKKDPAVKQTSRHPADVCLQWGFYSSRPHLCVSYCGVPELSC